jgi:peroxiredoxin
MAGVDTSHDPVTSGAPSEELLMLTSVAARHAVRAGQFAPTFRLQDLHGGTAAMVDLIGERSMVISFHRGIWCSFCDSALEALAGVDDEIKALGATQVAIGPEPGSEKQRHRLQALPMPVLVDRNLHVTASYGLVIALPAAMKAAYAEAGYTPPQATGIGKWKVPVPATYVIDRGGRIAMASIDIDYRNRLAPAQVLSALRCLQMRDAVL